MLELLIRAIGQGDKIKGIQVGKEVKLPLFIDEDEDSHTENSQERTQKTINDFDKFSRFKINTQKSVQFRMLATKKNQKMQLRKQFCFK